MTKNRFFLFLSIFLIIYIPVSLSGEYYNFVESFGSSAYSYDILTECSLLPNNVFYNLTTLYNNNFTINNREWYCVKNSCNFDHVYFLNESVYLNTDVALDTQATVTGGSNCLYGFYTPLDNEMSLIKSENSLFNLYCGGYANNQYNSIVFLDNTGNVKLRLELTGGTNTQCGISYINNAKCCELDLNTYCAGTSDINNVLFNLTELNGCNISASDLTGISYIGFEISNVGSNNLFLDDLNLTLFNGTNSLPEFNITNNITCINGSDSYVEIPLNWNIIDLENDTIYYVQANVIKSNTKVEYQKVTGGFVYSGNYDFLTNTKTEGYCNYGTGLFYTSDKHNIVTSSGDYKKLLELNPNCVGNNTEYLYKFDDLLSTGPYYETQLLGDLTTVGENINITFYNPLQLSVLNITLINTNANITVYVNSLDQGNFSLTDPINLIVLSNSTRNNTQIIINGNEINVSYFNNTQYVGIKSNTYIDQSYFSYNDRKLRFVWDTVQPQTKTFFSKGHYKVDYYITDDAHLNTDYTRQTVNFIVTECSYIPEGNTGKENLISGLFKTHFGNGLRAYIESFPNGVEIATKFLFLAFFFILFSMMIAEYVVTHNVSLVIPLFVSSISIGILAYLVQIHIVFITMLFTFALSVMIPLSKLFRGDH